MRPAACRPNSDPVERCCIGAAADAKDVGPGLEHAFGGGCRRAVKVPGDVVRARPMVERPGELVLTEKRQPETFVGAHR